MHLVNIHLSTKHLMQNSGNENILRD